MSYTVRLPDDGSSDTKDLFFGSALWYETGGKPSWSLQSTVGGLTVERTTYDSQGRVLELAFADQRDCGFPPEPESRTVFQYHLNNVLEIREYFRHPESNWQRVLERDGDGRVVRETLTRAGKLQQIVTYTYDRLSVEQVGYFNPERLLGWALEQLQDSNGRLLTTNRYTIDGPARTLTESTSYSYWSSGVIAEVRTRLLPDGGYRTTRYNDAGITASVEEVLKFPPDVIGPRSSGAMIAEATHDATGNWVEFRHWYFPRARVVPPDAKSAAPFIAIQDLHYCTASSSQREARLNGPSIATVTTDGLRRRERPSTDSPVLDMLNRGERVVVVGLQPGAEIADGLEGRWTQILTGHCRIGWVFGAYLKMENTPW